MYSAEPTRWRQNLAPTGATRSWLEEAKTGPTASWVSSEEPAIHDRIFAPSNGEYGPAMIRYKAQIANVNGEDKSRLTSGEPHMQQPTLLVTCSKDPIVIAGMQEQTTKQYAKNPRSSI